MPTTSTSSEGGVPLQRRVFGAGVDFTRRNITRAGSFQGRNINANAPENRQLVPSTDQKPIDRSIPAVKKIVTDAAPSLILAGTCLALQAFGRRYITPVATRTLTRLFSRANRLVARPPVQATGQEVATNALKPREGGLLQDIALRYTEFFSRHSSAERTASSLTTVFTTTASVVAGATITQISDKDKLKKNKIIQLTKQKSDEVLAKNEGIKSQLVDRKSQVETELAAHNQALEKLLSNFREISDSSISYTESLIATAKENLGKIEGAVKELKVRKPEDTESIQAAEQKIEQLKTMISSKEVEIAKNREGIYLIQAKIDILSEAVRENAQEALEKIESEIQQATRVLQDPNVSHMTDNESSMKEFSTNIATFTTGFLISAALQKFNLAKQLIGAFKGMGLSQKFAEKLLLSSVALSVQEKIKFHQDENISEKAAKEEINSILHEMGVDPTKHIDLGEHEEKLHQNIMSVFAGIAASMLTATINNEVLEKTLEAIITSSIQSTSSDLVHQHGSMEDAEKIIKEGFKPLENELNELLGLVEGFGEVELSQLENFTQKVDAKQRAALEGLDKMKKEADEISQLSDKALSEINQTSAEPEPEISQPVQPSIQDARPNDNSSSFTNHLFKAYFWLANLPDPFKDS